MTSQAGSLWPVSHRALTGRLTQDQLYSGDGAETWRGCGSRDSWGPCVSPGTGVSVWVRPSLSESLGRGAPASPVRPPSGWSCGCWEAASRTESLLVPPAPLIPHVSPLTLLSPLDLGEQRGGSLYLSHLSEATCRVGSGGVQLCGPLCQLPSLPVSRGRADFCSCHPASQTHVPGSAGLCHAAGDAGIPASPLPFLLPGAAPRQPPRPRTARHAPQDTSGTDPGI